MMATNIDSLYDIANAKNRVLKTVLNYIQSHELPLGGISDSIAKQISQLTSIEDESQLLDQIRSTYFNDINAREAKIHELEQSLAQLKYNNTKLETEKLDQYNQIDDLTARLDDYDYQQNELLILKRDIEKYKTSKEEFNEGLRLLLEYLQTVEKINLLTAFINNEPNVFIDYELENFLNGNTAAYEIAKLITIANERLNNAKRQYDELIEREQLTINTFDSVIKDKVAQIDTIFAEYKEFANLYNSNLLERLQLYNELNNCIIMNANCNLYNYLLRLNDLDLKFYDKLKIKKDIEKHAIPKIVINRLNPSIFNDNFIENDDYLIDAESTINKPFVRKNQLSIQTIKTRESIRKTLEKYNYDIEVISNDEFKTFVSLYKKQKDVSIGYIKNIINTIKAVNKTFTLNASNFGKQQYKKKQLTKENIDSLILFVQNAVSHVVNNIYSEFITVYDTNLAVLLTTLTNLRTNEIMQLKISDLEHIKDGNRVNVKFKKQNKSKIITTFGLLYNQLYPNIMKYIQLRNELAKNSKVNNINFNTDRVIIVSSVAVNNYILTCLKPYIENKSLGLKIFRTLTTTNLINEGHIISAQALNQHSNKITTLDNYSFANPDKLDQTFNNA